MVGAPAGIAPEGVPGGSVSKSSFVIGFATVFLTISGSSANSCPSASFTSGDTRGIRPKGGSHAVSQSGGLFQDLGRDIVNHHFTVAQHAGTAGKLNAALLNGNGQALDTTATQMAIAGVTTDRAPREPQTPALASPRCGSPWLFRRDSWRVPHFEGPRSPVRS